MKIIKIIKYHFAGTTSIVLLEKIIRIESNTNNEVNKREKLKPKTSNLSSYTLPIANIEQANKIYDHEKISLIFIAIVF